MLEAKVDEFVIVPGDVVQYTWQGGGGYGDPLDRDPERVARDVEERKMSEERAREVYGVVLGDPAATEDLRGADRRDRLERASRRASAGRGSRASR